MKPELAVQCDAKCPEHPSLPRRWHSLLVGPRERPQRPGGLERFFFCHRRGDGVQLVGKVFFLVFRVKNWLMELDAGEARTSGTCHSFSRHVQGLESRVQRSTTH